MPTSMVKATLMMYGIPLIGLIIGVTAGSLIGGDAAGVDKRSWVGAYSLYNYTSF